MATRAWFHKEDLAKVTAEDSPSRVRNGMDVVPGKLSYTSSEGILQVHPASLSGKRTSAFQMDTVVTPCICLGPGLSCEGICASHVNAASCAHTRR